VVNFLEKKEQDFSLYVDAIASNWNFLNSEQEKNMERALEKHDIEMAWIDEVDGCIECNKVVHLFHGHWPEYIRTGYYETGDFLACLCRDCVDKMDEDELENLAQEYNDNENAAMPAWMQDKIKSLGFHCLEDECTIYETGFHPGQNDNPAQIAKWMHENLPDHDFIFVITGGGQFDTYWTVYVRKQA
jgi:hypothetical protein